MLPEFDPQKDALFFDIDGTLIDLADSPDEVVVPAQLVDDLARLHKKFGGALALVSGRSLATIDMLFAPLKLPASGVHGAQYRMDNNMILKPELAQEAREAISYIFDAYEGVIVEDKKHSIAVHYRHCPKFEQEIYAILQDFINQQKLPVTILKGKMVFEITSINFNKGDAVEFFMAHPPFKGRRPIFIGDDETDSFAMDICKKMGGLGIWVSRNDEAYGFITAADIRNWIGGIVK